MKNITASVWYYALLLLAIIQIANFNLQYLKTDIEKKNEKNK